MFAPALPYASLAEVPDLLSNSANPRAANALNLNPVPNIFLFPPTLPLGLFPPIMGGRFFNPPIDNIAAAAAFAILKINFIGFNIKLLTAT